MTRPRPRSAVRSAFAVFIGSAFAVFIGCGRAGGGSNDAPPGGPGPDGASVADRAAAADVSPPAQDGRSADARGAETPLPPPPSDARVSDGASAGPSFGACPIFPADNPWNRDVSGDPVDPDSDRYLARMNAATGRLHPDFGANPAYGIPWVAVPGSQPKVPVTFQYASESDPGPYPIPPDAPIEGGPGATGDRHVLVIDRDGCRLFELFSATFVGPGWRAGSGAIFDLRSNALRPAGWTSADAAGLPIFPGLVRRAEVQAGEIRHALRFTVSRTQAAYVAPATHWASAATDPDLPPMGLRVRLKASFDLSRFSGAPRVVLAALQKYGMLVADNGSDWYISGETNTLWSDAELAPLKTVPASAFEVVKLGTVVRR